MELYEKNKKWTIKKIAAGTLFFCYLAAFLFVAYLLEYGPIKVIRYVCLAAGVFYLADFDVKSKIVPNRILLVLLAVRTVLLLLEAFFYPGYFSSFVLSSFFGAALAMLILFVGNLICKKGMGYGDIKLFGVIGYYVGPQTVLGVLFFSLLFAAVYSILLLLMKKIKAKDEIPFVPFIFAGLAAASLLGI